MDVDKIQGQVTLMLPAITYKEGLSNISVGKLQMGPMPRGYSEKCVRLRLTREQNHEEEQQETGSRI